MSSFRPVTLLQNNTPFFVIAYIDALFVCVVIAVVGLDLIKKKARHFM